jgi:predicted HicB family RNase H-like nuclease
MARGVTSIRIDKDLWKKAKHHAIDEGITLTELVERALKKEINSN